LGHLRAYACIEAGERADSWFSTIRGREVVARREDDRRQNPRFLCGGKAEMRSLSSGSRVEGRIQNLSLGGCRIEGEERAGFRAGEKVEITFCVRQLPLRVQAVICPPFSGNRVSARFTLLSERGKRQLLALIEELDEVARGQLEDLLTQPHPVPGPSLVPNSKRRGNRNDVDPA
jgi:hypothetical protein